MKWENAVVNGVEVKFTCYDESIGPEYLATRDENGKFHVATHDGEFKEVPFTLEFPNYQEMNIFFSQYVHLDIPIVCHVKHSAPNAYVLLTRTKTYYIRTEE